MIIDLETKVAGQLKWAGYGRGTFTSTIVEKRFHLWLQEGGNIKASYRGFHFEMVSKMKNEYQIITTNEIGEYITNYGVVKALKQGTYGYKQALIEKIDSLFNDESCSKKLTYEREYGSTECTINRTEKEYKIKIVSLYPEKQKEFFIQLRKTETPKGYDPEYARGIIPHQMFAGHLGILNAFMSKPFLVRTYVHV